MARNFYIASYESATGKKSQNNPLPNVASYDKATHMITINTTKSQPTAEVRPMQVGQAVARLLPTSEVRKMVESLRSHGGFTIIETAETVKIHHTQFRRQVLVALAKGPRGPWICRIHSNLFA